MGIVSFLELLVERAKLGAAFVVEASAASKAAAELRESVGAATHGTHTRSLGEMWADIVSKPHDEVSHAARLAETAATRELLTGFFKR